MFRIFTVDEVDILGSIIVGILCVDYELLEGKQDLHLFFVDFCIDDVLEENQFVQIDSKVVASDHHSGLSLDLYCCNLIGWVRKIKLNVIVVVSAVMGLNFW